MRCGANCNGNSWEKFTPYDADHMRNCENLMGNLIGSKNMVRSRGGDFLFSESNPKISTVVVLIRGRELAVSYRLQNHPILSSSIYLLKSPRCPCYFAFHAFTTWSDQQWVDRFFLIGGNLYLHEHNKYLSGSKEGCGRRNPPSLLHDQVLSAI